LRIVDPSDTSALRQIWAKATPLSKFIEERTKRLPEEAIPADRDTNRADGLPTGAADLVPQLANLARYAGVLAAVRVARDRAEADTINDLAAGQLVALGRRSGSYDIETIDGSFWIGADVAGNAVARAGTEIIDVRIVLPDALPVMQPKQQSDLEAKRRAEVIREAIRDYAAKIDPNLGPPRSKRYKAYRSYISSRGFDIKKRGFSDKTFEKAETEFRREARRKSK
jgi:hypothetical protein